MCAVNNVRTIRAPCKGAAGDRPAPPCPEQWELEFESDVEQEPAADTPPGPCAAAAPAAAPAAPAFAPNRGSGLDDADASPVSEGSQDA